MLHTYALFSSTSDSSVYVALHHAMRRKDDL